MMLRLGKTGFTLIELMIVIGIVAILVSIAIPMMKLQHDKAKLSEVISSMSSVSTAVCHYYEDYQCFPSINDGAAILTTLGVAVPFGYPEARIGGIRIQIGSIITTVANVSQRLDGEELILTPSTTGAGALTWSWSGSAGFPAGLLPSR